MDQWFTKYDFQSGRIIIFPSPETVNEPVTNMYRYLILDFVSKKHIPRFLYYMRR